MHLDFCYENPLGKILLELIVKWPWLSTLYGIYQDSDFSKSKITQFIRELSIDENEAEKPVNQYANFNEFFARKLKPEARPTCPDEDRFIMPVRMVGLVLFLKSVKIEFFISKV